jgi:hypothetical protein
VGYLALTCRCLLGVVFLAAVATKVRGAAAFGRFAHSLVPFAAVGYRWRRPVAAGVVVAEAAVPVLLAVPAWTLAGFGWAVLVLAAFTAAIVRSLRRGIRAPCHCFGPSARPLGSGHVTRNAALGLAGLVGAVATLAGAAATPGAAPTGPGPGAVLAAAALGLALAVPVLWLDDVVDLFSVSR